MIQMSEKEYAMKRLTADLRNDDYNEGEEGDEGDQRIGEDVAQGDAGAAKAEAARGLHVGHAPQAKRLRAHVVGDAYPVEERVADDEQAEASAVERSHQNHDVEEGEGAPDFCEPLPDDVHLAAKIALQDARDGAAAQ